MVGLYKYSKTARFSFRRDTILMLDDYVAMCNPSFNQALYSMGIQHYHAHALGSMLTFSLTAIFTGPNSQTSGAFVCPSLLNCLEYI